MKWRDSLMFFFNIKHIHFRNKAYMFETSEYIWGMQSQCIIELFPYDTLNTFCVNV